MPVISRPDGVSIACFDTGPTAAPRPPVLLVHGFASSWRTNWRLPGWIAAFQRAGRRVVALDCRGHGESSRPHEPAAYAGEAMPGDVIAVLDALEIEVADLMGYSMGGRIAASLLASHGSRFAHGVLAGVGGALLQAEAEAERAERIARVLEAERLPADAPEDAQAFRRFAERQGGDLRALAACMRGMPRTVEAAQLARIALPTRVVVGAEDRLAGDPHLLARAIPRAGLVLVEGRDHMSAVPARATRQAVLAFLDEGSPSAAAAARVG